MTCSDARRVLIIDRCVFWLYQGQTAPATCGFGCAGKIIWHVEIRIFAEPLLARFTSCHLRAQWFGQVHGPPASHWSAPAHVWTVSSHAAFPRRTSAKVLQCLAASALENRVLCTTSRGRAGHEHEPRHVHVQELLGPNGRRISPTSRRVRIPTTPFSSNIPAQRSLPGSASPASRRCSAWSCYPADRNRGWPLRACR